MAAVVVSLGEVSMVCVVVRKYVGKEGVSSEIFGCKLRRDESLWWNLDYLPR
jgi:hypothetical protein